MLRTALQLAAISAVTLVFGLLAILTMIVVPNGDPLLWYARPWSRALLVIARARLRVEGADRVPRDRACVLMSNHQSHFDVPALILAIPGQFRILAKRELFYIPVFGWAIWLAGFIPVDRARRDRAVQSIDRAAEQVRRGRSVLIFAEGTRSPDGTLQPFKKGGFHLAAKAGAPIIPIAVRGSREILPKGGRRIVPGTIEVVFGEPVESGEEIEPVVPKVRRAIQSGLGPLAPRPTG